MEQKFFSTDTHIGAVHLNVNFLENSVRFYNEILGMNIIEQTDAYVALGVGERKLVYLYQTNEKRTQTAGLFHMAFLVPSREDLGNIFFHLIKTQYPLHGASDHDVSEAIYLADPEDNGIEIYRDLPSKDWQWRDNGDIVMGTVEMDYQGVLDANQNRPFNGMPEGTIVGHMHLQVLNIENTVKFYEDVFGMDVMTNYGHQAAFMSAGGYHHHLGLNTWQGQTAPASISLPGLRKYEINIPNEEDLAYFTSKIESLGLKTLKDGNSDIILDPNNIAIQVMVKQ